MEAGKELHMFMVGGSGTTSYAQNSLLQQKVLSMTKPIRDSAITSLIRSPTFPRKRLAIADLGCASGPNTLLTVSELVQSFVRICKNLGREAPEEFQVFLNDLPGNDFNGVFRSLQDFRQGNSEMVMLFNGVPGSFYGRLFAAESLHLVHSSYSLHWLSQVPEDLVEDNRGNISYGRNSPQGVFESYLAQFRKDFAEFLRCRGVELVSGGKMVLTFLGRTSDDASRCCYSMDLMSTVLYQMASEGLIDIKRLGRFSIPHYMPSLREVEDEVKKHGSFTIDSKTVKETSWDPYEGEVNLPEALKDGGYNVSKYLRAVLEPLFVSHFDFPTEIMDEVFRRYSVILSKYMIIETTSNVNITLSLTRQ